MADVEVRWCTVDGRRRHDGERICLATYFSELKRLEFSIFSSLSSRTTINKRRRRARRAPPELIRSIPIALSQEEPWVIDSSFSFCYILVDRWQTTTSEI